MVHSVEGVIKSSKLHEMIIMWEELVSKERIKLGMDSMEPHNCSEWRGYLQGRQVRQAHPWEPVTKDDDDEIRLNVSRKSSASLITPLKDDTVSQP